MMKHLYILLLTAGAVSVNAQNDNNFGNINLTNIGNMNNPPVSQAQSNFTGNQAFLQGSLHQLSLDNNNGQLDNKANNDVPQQQAINENNVSEAAQQAPANQSKSTNNDPISFSLQKPSVSFGGGSSRSSGKSHNQGFSKKMKKFNRRMSYVFSKKHKKSYTVDFCFAWAK